METVGLISDSDCPKAEQHHKLEKAATKKSEDDLQQVLAAIKNFTNSFDIAVKDRLYSLASRAPMFIIYIITSVRLYPWQGLNPCSWYYMIDAQTLLA